ncbi:MAG: cupin domain-containing protein [Desmonostoc vinosum HA7617-LM4]|nr:cupin domain-containing protein [Desmonostoc vinosum HA7617-LM4]
MNQPADFFVRSAVPETTRSYMGGLLTFLATSAETGNRSFLLEVQTVPGAEPPPHLHYEQDEVFYILEGEIEVYCMGQVRIARAGEMVFLPRMQAHAFYFLSPLHFLALVQPGGIDGYFEAMSTPATSMEIPANATTYAESDPAAAIALAAKYGVKMLNSEETAELLPHYPGFGVPRLG